MEKLVVHDIGSSKGSEDVGEGRPWRNGEILSICLGRKYLGIGEDESINTFLGYARIVW